MRSPDRVLSRDWLSAVAIVVALAVHLVTVLIAAAAVAVWFTGLALFVRAVLSALLAMTLLAVQPVDRRRRRRRVPSGWTREQAPTCFALLDQITAAIGAKAPQLLVPTAKTSAFSVTIGGTTCLAIGVPLWESLDDGGRIALLAHELGHQVNRDIGRHWWVRSALVSARNWRVLCWPGQDGVEQAMDDLQGVVLVLPDAGRRFGSGRISQVGQFVVFLPFYLLSITVGTVLSVGVSRAAQRAEYRADRMALGLAGHSGLADLFDSLDLAGYVREGMRSGAMRRDPDIIRAIPDRVAQVPASERQRLRRRASARLTRVDGGHPPTAFRAEYAEKVTVTGGSVVDQHLAGPATEELLRAAPELERGIRTALGVTDHGSGRSPVRSIPPA